MKFDQKYLTDLVKGRTRGEFPPFSLGKWEKSDEYLKNIVGRLNSIRTIEVEADFDHYGSGFSSYVPLYLSKKDKSDFKVTRNGNERSEETNGLMIYLCRMAPYAIYSEGTWFKRFKNDKWILGGSHYIEPEEIGSKPKVNWEMEWTEIENILNQYGITILTREELDKKLDFDIRIPTILTEPPFRIFDCLFYWED